MYQFTPPTPLLRTVEPLGLYFRPGRNDHTKLLQVMSAKPLGFTGAVLDASLEKRHKELRLHLAAANLESVLDPMALELATEGGWERDALRLLPWAGDMQHHATYFAFRGARQLVAPIAEFCVNKGYSSLIAPTHYLKDGVADPWWQVDRQLATELRRQLDAAGKRDTPIYYRLAIARTTLMDPKQRDAIIGGLRELDIDTIWLCLHPVNARRSGSNVLRSYIDLCSDLARVGVPLVAERTGFLGTTLLGFNAVGGIESGITVGESFDATRLLRPRSTKPEDTHYVKQSRIYLPSLGIFLDPQEARTFFSKPHMRRRFGCQDQGCCRTPEDTFRDPRRHLVITRVAEVNKLTRIPAHNRPTIQLEFIRNASDNAIHAAKVDDKFAKDRDRLASWRIVLSNMIERNEYSRAIAAPPIGRLRQRRSA